MSNINDEMKATADYAIKSAKEMFGQELGYTEQNIDKLDNLLDQAYQSFGNLPKDEKTKSAINRTANIWGSYLGEFMRLKWGGTWIQKGSERFVSINNIEFSSINFVYQKITNHPEYTAEKYLSEAESKIHPLLITPALSQNLSENISQTKEQDYINRPQKTVMINKTLIYIIASIGVFLLVIIFCMLGYMIFKIGGTSAFGNIDSTPSSNTNNPTEETIAAANPYPTYTQYPTTTPYPSYTPNATYTPFPSYTPNPTYTQLPTLIPTETQKPIVPTQALIPSPTSVPDNPTNIPNPPTQPPIPTQWYPEPTATSSVPIDITCWSEPSVVSGTGGMVTFYGALQQGGQFINTGPMNVSWQAYRGSGSCGASGGSSPRSCEGHYAMVLPHSCASVQVRIFSVNGNSYYDCPTSFCAP